MKDGKPWLAFAVQGGDTQDQNLLQFFLNVVEFGMTPQEATEAANFNSYQMRSRSASTNRARAADAQRRRRPTGVARELTRTRLQARVRRQRTSGPINAIMIDHEHGTLWGGSSNHGEDYGIAW